MRTFILAVLLGFTAAAGFCFAENPPDTAWTMRYGGMSTYPDYAKGIAVDTANFVYVAGSHRFNTVYPAIGIVKYDPVTGDTIWTRTYIAQGVQAAACVIDDSGRLFMTGRIGTVSNPDYLIICFDASTGDTVWSRRYNGTANSYDYAYACALDDSGHLYVVGSSNNGSTNDYLLLRCSSATGDTVWSRIHHTGANIYAYGCATDRPGDIYITGTSGTLKYNSAGDTLWTRPYGGNSCTTDDSGNVYIAGSSGILKYNGNGDSIWWKGRPGNGCTYRGGRLFVTGSTGNVGHEDVLTVCLNSINGDSIWAMRSTGTVDSTDIGWACAIDNAGSLFVTGSSVHPYQFGYMTTKHEAATGNTLWTRYYSIPFDHGNAFGWGCAVDTMRSELYVSGGAYGLLDFQNYDFLTLRCSLADGMIVGALYYDDQRHNRNWGYRCALNPANSALYVSGVSAPIYGMNDSWDVVRYAADTWDTVWTKDYHWLSAGDFIFDCVTDHAGQYLYVCGILGDSASTSLMDGGLLKWSAVNGDTVWSRRYHCPSDSAAGYLGVATSKSDDTVYVSGNTNNGSHSVGLIEAINSATGDTLWSRTYDVGVPLTLMDCAVGHRGDTLYAVGYARWNAFYAAFDAVTGNTLFTREYQAGDTTGFCSCHLDQSGRYLYAVGMVQHPPDTVKCLVVKYDVATGDSVWSKRIALDNCKTVDAYSCDLDQFGDLYIAGHANYGSGKYKFFAIKLKTGTTGVAGSPAITAAAFMLGKNTPNPFAATTAIRYQLPGKCNVTLAIYNIAGQLVRTLVNGEQSAGAQAIVWNGRDDRGARVSAGVYLYRLSSAGRSATGKMLVMK